MLYAESYLHAEHSRIQSGLLSWTTGLNSQLSRRHLHSMSHGHLKLNSELLISLPSSVWSLPSQEWMTAPFFYFLRLKILLIFSPEQHIQPVSESYSCYLRIMQNLTTFHLSAIMTTTCSNPLLIISSRLLQFFFFFLQLLLNYVPALAIVHSVYPQRLDKVKWHHSFTQNLPVASCLSIIKSQSHHNDLARYLFWLFLH